MDWRQACDLIQQMRQSIQGPVLSTTYVSSFWIVPYLHSLGVSLANVRRFFDLAKPVLLHNLSQNGTNGDGVQDAQILQPLFSLAREIARELDAG